jgi:NNP family nitrate/nitrite transporter-like MFS transporter
LGPKRAIGAVLAVTGGLTVMLGLAPGAWVVALVFLQPMVAVCFFPAAFSALSRIGPSQVRPVAVSLTVPAAFLMGGGAIPAGIGVLGDAGSFSLAICLLGLLTVASVWLLPHLSLREA